MSEIYTLNKIDIVLKNVNYVTDISVNVIDRVYRQYNNFKEYDHYYYFRIYFSNDSYIEINSIYYKARTVKYFTDNNNFKSIKLTEAEIEDGYNEWLKDYNVIEILSKQRDDFMKALNIYLSNCKTYEQ